MKYTSILALSLMFSASAFAATQITQGESAAYVQIGQHSIDRSGVPPLGQRELSQKADLQCQIHGVAISNCYYVVIDKAPREPNHQKIDLAIFKK